MAQPVAVYDPLRDPRQVAHQRGVRDIILPSNYRWTINTHEPLAWHKRNLPVPPIPQELLRQGIVPPNWEQYWNNLVHHKEMFEKSPKGQELAREVNDTMNADLAWRLAHPDVDLARWVQEPTFIAKQEAQRKFIHHMAPILHITAEFVDRGIMPEGDLAELIGRGMQGVGKPEELAKLDARDAELEDMYNETYYYLKEQEKMVKMYMDRIQAAQDLIARPSTPPKGKQPRKYTQAEIDDFIRQASDHDREVQRLKASIDDIMREASDIRIKKAELQQAESPEASGKLPASGQGKPDPTENMSGGAEALANDDKPGNAIAEGYALTEDDIRKLCGNIPILRYPDLAKFATPDDLFKDGNAVVLLFLTESQDMGHWLCVLNHPGEIEVFDSYGVSFCACPWCFCISTRKCFLNGRNLVFRSEVKNRVKLPT